MVGVVAVAAGGVVRADEAALKREIDALRREVEALKKEVAAQMPGVAPTKETLTARYEAAKGLRTVAAERKALAGVAVDAARAGEVELTAKALDDLWTVELEQQTMLTKIASGQLDD